METIITLIVVLIVIWILFWVVGQIPFPTNLANAKWIAYVLIAIIAIYLLLQLVLGVKLF
jgi:hypothetical protein